jgi:uncharacterized protein with NRDE domain
MCIVALAWQVIEDTPICLISNRDEFYQRATQALQPWPDSHIIAGRDLEQGGTWMGITATGRWAVLTNFRNAHDKNSYPTSRGHLVSDFLNSDLAPIRFAKQLEAKQCDYAGFNLICGDQHQAVYMSNRGEAPQVLPRGVYVVSNGLMSEGWEKTRHLRKRFTQEFLPLLQQPNAADLEFAVWDILEDQRKILPELLPETGISSEMEQLLSSTFIQSANYGTRCSNFLCLKEHIWLWLEKNQYGEQVGQIVKISQKLQ